MLKRRTYFAYGLLTLSWLLIALWQFYEHGRFEDSARKALLTRARDISESLAVVVRSQGKGGFVPKERLEAALNALTKSEELRSVVLLNAAGEITADAGEPVVLETSDLVEKGERWDDHSVTFVNLVDLGAVAPDDDAPTTPIVMPGLDRPEHDGGPGEPPFDAPPPPPDAKMFGSLLSLNEDNMRTLDSLMAKPALSNEDVDTFLALLPADMLDARKRESVRALLLGVPLREENFRTIMAIALEGRIDQQPPERERHPAFHRPPWVSEDTYNALLESQGVHWFVIALSLDDYQARLGQDLNMRIIVAGIALLAVAAMAIGWYNAERSARLQMHLLQAQQETAHLQEMNVAAAGLAHETRNPLNLVRGKAQMIAYHPQVDTGIRARAQEITEEVDRVTARLNQFMDYSRPAEPKLAATHINAVVRDVARALESDLEDKEIELEVSGPDLVAEADESLVRQVLFNLMLNAIQAVGENGKIAVVLYKHEKDGAGFEVRDNGPGVPDEARDQVFRPYFTTFEGGTGLGLAVVRQIVLAHHWGVECLANKGGGAVFRVSGLRVI